MKKLSIIITVAITCLMFTSCKKSEEKIKYNLTSVSPEYNQIFEYIDSNKTETDSIYSLDFSNLCEKLDNLERNELSSLNSITVYSENFDDDKVKDVIKLCKKENIPVIFSGGKISEDLLSSYDKAFNITIDYQFVGENFASIIHDNWTENIIDRDKNKILSFTVVNTAENSDNLQSVYDNLIYNLELLGVPTKQYPDVSDSLDAAVDYCKNNKNQNEVFITFSDDLLTALHEDYPPVGEKIEILGLDFGFENVVTEDENIMVYFINYINFINARNQIISNIENKNYPFDNFEYNFIGKTAYIQ